MNPIQKDVDANAFLNKSKGHSYIGQSEKVVDF